MSVDTAGPEKQQNKTAWSPINCKIFAHGTNFLALEAWNVLTDDGNGMKPLATPRQPAATVPRF